MKSEKWSSFFINFGDLLNEEFYNSPIQLSEVIKRELKKGAKHFMLDDTMLME